MTFDVAMLRLGPINLFLQFSIPRKKKKDKRDTKLEPTLWPLKGKVGKIPPLNPNILDLEQLIIATDDPEIVF